MCFAHTPKTTISQIPGVAPHPILPATAITHQGCGFSLMAMDATPGSPDTGLTSGYRTATARLGMRGSCRADSCRHQTPPPEANEAKRPDVLAGESSRRKSGEPPQRKERYTDPVLSSWPHSPHLESQYKWGGCRALE